MATWLLALDTSTPRTALAVGRIDRNLGRSELVAQATHDDRGRPASAELAPRIAALLAEAEITAQALGAVACGRGPGMFTGSRVAVATAKGLALGLGCPLYGLSTLAVIAGAEGNHGPTLALLDARRGEVYAAAYRHHRCTMEPIAIAPAELAERVAARREWGRSPMLGVGDGAVRFRAELERAGVAVPSDGSRAHRVSALMVGRLGRAREPVDRDALLPDYRREPDAVPPPPPL